MLSSTTLSTVSIVPPPPVSSFSPPHSTTNQSDVVYVTTVRNAGVSFSHQGDVRACSSIAPCRHNIELKCKNQNCEHLFFETRDVLHSHLLTHVKDMIKIQGKSGKHFDNKLICLDCESSRIFDTKTLIHHYLKKHHSFFPLPCNHCHHYFWTESELRMHKITKHDDK